MPKLLSAVAIALVSSLVHVSAQAQAPAWPSKPVRLIVPAPPGSAPDIITRLVADRLSPLWNRPVIIDNRPGAGGNVAMNAFNRGERDGHTLASVMATVLTLTPHLFKELQYNVDTDVAPVALLGISPMMVAVSPALGVNTMQEFVALAKGKPGAMNFAPPLLNSVPHLAGEMLSGAAGIKLTAVPYNGSVPAVTAVITGESQITIDGLPPLVPQVRAGKLKALAVSAKRRLPGYENLPLLSEIYPGVEAIGWFSVLAHPGTPQSVIDRVNRDINQVLQIPEVVARLAELGVYPEAVNTPRSTAEFIQAERALWTRVVKEAGIKPQ